MMGWGGGVGGGEGKGKLPANAGIFPFRRLPDRVSSDMKNVNLSVIRNCRFDCRLTRVTGKGSGSTLN